ncbi:hypothetical protein POTOM_024384 [Populus tomentosa]|uniref:Uncharacterized protein n=1 Tax=Populus tomentosa TaxID=118781 RepID=A0A8X8D1U3_POPTO|nr:hypothetical protein POTOM_024384 [Populus tomentosa]
MPSLQKLLILDCSKLKSLSESESQGMIPYLPSLQFLRIEDCSEELRGRTRGWGKEREEEWPRNIKHIPDIVIEGYYIQKEGRYAKTKGYGGWTGFYKSEKVITAGIVIEDVKNRFHPLQLGNNPPSDNSQESVRLLEDEGLHPLQLNEFHKPDDVHIWSSGIHLG